MVAEIGDQHDSEWAAMTEVARSLGVGMAETALKWVCPGSDRCRCPPGSDDRGVGRAEEAASEER